MVKVLSSSVWSVNWFVPVPWTVPVSVPRFGGPMSEVFGTGVTNSENVTPLAVDKFRPMDPSELVTITVSRWISSLNARGAEPADKVTGKGEEVKLKVNGPLVVGVTWQTLPTAQVELIVVSEALKIVSCGLENVRFIPL